MNQIRNLYSSNETHLTSENIWVLKQLHNIGFKSAIIAGGAVRDSYFKRPINDIDIYYWHPGYSEGKEKNQNTELPFSALFDLNMQDTELFDADEVKTVFKSANQTKKNGYENLTGIVSVTDIIKNEQKYQFIGTEIPPPQYATTKFDFHICMCYCDGKKMRYTNEFLTDAMNRTLTINPNLSDYRYGLVLKTRLAKMKNYFPRFTLIDKRCNG